MMTFLEVDLDQWVEVWAVSVANSLVLLVVAG